jgi:hypothetical protein
LKVNDENSRSRSRIHLSQAWIRGSRSGSWSTSKCHGSATLAIPIDHGGIYIHNCKFGRFIQKLKHKHHSADHVRVLSIIFYCFPRKLNFWGLNIVHKCLVFNVNKFLQSLQWQKSQQWDPSKQRAEAGFGAENSKKISQIINEWQWHLYLPVPFLWASRRTISMKSICF